MPTKADVDRMRRIVDKTRARGTRVTFVRNWDTRGAGFPGKPKGGVVHHDASSSKSGTWGALATVVAGRPDLRGPLSQFQVARGGTPQLAVVAAGIANHAGTGGPKIGVPANRGNQELYGSEVANNGTGEPYTKATIKAITDLFASIMEVLGEDEKSTIGHREWTSRKIDPTYDMNWLRGLIAAEMAGENDVDWNERVEISSDYVEGKLGLKEITRQGMAEYGALAFTIQKDVDRLEEKIADMVTKQGSHTTKLDGLAREVGEMQATLQEILTKIG